MNLTIKSKLIGGFTIILVLLISTLFFIINKFSESNVRLTTIAEVYSKKINLADELMIAVLNEASNEKNIIMEKDIIQMDNYKDNIYKELETIDNKTIELQELSDEKGILFLNEFKTTWAEYKPQLNKIISLTMNDKKDEASSISFEIGLKTRNIAIAQLQRIIDKNEKSMENAKIENNASYNAAVNLIIALIIVSIFIAIIISYWIIQSITKRISLIATEAEKIANREFSNEKLEDNTNDELKPIFNSLVSVNESFREIAENANNVADGNYTVNLIPRSDKDILANALIKMTRSLLETTEANKKHNWLAVGQIQLNEKLSGDQSIEELANKVISFLCTYLNANIGTVYRLNDKDKTLVLCGQYAFSSQESIKEKFALNEGLIGQAAWEQKQMLLTDITENQLRITSSVLDAKPKNLIITPFLLDGKTLGVIEIGKFTDFSETEKEFIDVSMNSISISVYSVHQALEKENRAAELRIANKELAFQNEEKEKRAAELIIANYARSLIEASLDPLVTISAEGKILDVNEASVKVTGIPREKLIDTDFSNYFTEPKKAQEGYLQVFEKGFVSDYPLTIKHKNGNLTDVLYNASVYKDAKGNVLGVFAAARDVTEQKQVSQYARSLIEASLDPLITISAEGKILDVNEASVKVTGIPREKLIDTDFSNYFTEPKKAQEGYLQVFEKGFVSDYPLTIKHKNGNLTDVLYNASVYKDEKGNVLGVFAAARDVTEQKQASQYARSLIEASLDPLVTISAEGKILDVNEASIKVTGVPREKLIDTVFSNYFTEPKKAQEGYLQVFEKGFVSDYPLTIKHKNGNLTDVLYNASVYKDAKGNVLGVFAAARDVTEQQWTIDLKIANKELGQQAEELQSQQEELKHMNEELEEQAQNLKAQQEELQMSNEELEEQTQSLEEKNKEVEASKYDIEQKTIQLEISSKYKSEFLANMSHELRTPLNSLLILSKDLSENKKKNLDAIQVECSEIIYKSGHDLLVLINEVLDLSKIEAGMMTINIESVSLKNISDRLIQEFKHLAEQKKLKLTCTLDKELPEFIRTDSQRLNQILKNLLSNAIKFTEKGKVSINIKRNTDSTLIVSVTDTGIGIQENKQMAIFEAFQQADGGTSRKYGGTGLGLSISRELAKLLGAEIKLSSKLNEGSTFSLIIPIEINPEQEPITPNMVKDSILYKPRSEKGSKYLNYPTIEDDRETITKDDKVVLIIEDDLNFSTILLKQANTKGFKCLFAATGEDGLLLASKYKPQAIILDMELPGINGHTVLHELKANPSLRHIPVHIISANERSLLPIKEGAVEYLMKPVNKNDLEEAFNRIENFVNRKIKNLLIIEDNENSRKAMRILIGNGDVKCLEAGTGKEALTIYEQNNIDCIILDIGLPDISGFDLIHKIENIKSHQIPPIIIYTGKELTKEENNELQKYAETIIIKGIKSEERLLDETALFLHRTVSNLPKSKQDIIHNLYDKESVFHSKKILLVDDDMRNVFALSKVLQERGMEIIKAENGKIALEMMGKHPAIDMVLMDIMMPEMDGYEAMKQIRSQVKFKNIPVIALTAKAMKDDKQKCIDAGANDYIAKPIDVERLLSLMRVWLSK